MGGRKITGSPRAKLEEFWGRSTAKRFFNEKKIVLAVHFDSVWWLGYEKAMAGYPKTFRTFVTKQVSGWCCQETSRRDTAYKRSLELCASIVLIF